MKSEHFSYEQKAGQLIMAGFSGTEMNQELAFLIDTIKVGGIILFLRNIKSPEQVKKLCKSAQEYAVSCGQPPLFIAIDQEGGVVSRLKAPFTQFPEGCPGMKCPEDAENFAAVTADELNSIGVNMDMAPVMDLSPLGMDSIMKNRAFGHDPEWVATMGIKIIEVLQKKKIMAVAKHFPGIGRTTLDSHMDLPYSDIDADLMAATDFLPFEASIKKNVSGIMLSHILYKNLDHKWPASLSRKIAHDLLRNHMGFDGLVMTDDLDMGAIKKHYDLNTVVNRILTAGIDIILICKMSSDIKNAYNIVLKTMNESEEMRASTERSVERILKAKKEFFL